MSMTRAIADVVLVSLLFIAGCVDSVHPLSAPAKSKLDSKLIGTWRIEREKGESVYVHVGKISNKKLPAAVLRVVVVVHTDGGLEGPIEYLAFPSDIGGRHYLNLTNVTGEYEKRLRAIDEKGFVDAVAGPYSFMRYDFQGERLVLWQMDEKAKQQAIEDGDIVGNADEKILSDTSEKLAHLIASASDDLFDDDPAKLERVESSNKH